MKPTKPSKPGKGKPPPVIVLGKKNLGPGMMKREKSKWEAKRKKILEARKVPSSPWKHTTYAFTYPKAQARTSALRFMPNELAKQWFALPTAIDTLDAIMKHVVEVPLKEYGIRRDGEESVEANQFTALNGVLGSVHMLLRCEDEAGKKNAVWQILNWLTTFGIASESKHALRAREMSSTRQSPDSELDSLAMEIFENQPATKRNLREAVREAAGILGRQGQEEVACHNRLKQRISRNSRKEGQRDS